MEGDSPRSFRATGGRVRPNNEGNIFDHIDVFYEFPDNVRAFMAQRQITGCYSDNSDYLMGSDGVGTIKGFGEPTIAGKENWRYSGPKADMYQVEHDELFASIRAGKPINDGGTMIDSTYMAIMGQLACYSGKPVTWEQMMAADFEFEPKVADARLDMPPPIKPDKPDPTGNYPLPKPGFTDYLK